MQHLNCLDSHPFDNFDFDIIPKPRGAGPGCNTQEVSERLLKLKDEIAVLDKRERELDEHKMWVQQSIRNVTEDVLNHRYGIKSVPMCELS